MRARTAFCEFFRDAYQPLVRDVIFAGGDPGLLVWEQQEWVTLLLKSLPAAQRQVLACLVDMFTAQEIAQLLGKTEAAVRQNLCAARKRLAGCLGGEAR